MTSVRAIRSRRLRVGFPGHASPRNSWCYCITLQHLSDSWFRDMIKLVWWWKIYSGYMANEFTHRHIFSIDGVEWIYRCAYFCNGKYGHVAVEFAHQEQNAIIFQGKSPPIANLKTLQITSHSNLGTSFIKCRSFSPISTISPPIVTMLVFEWSGQLKIRDHSCHSHKHDSHHKHSSHHLHLIHVVLSHSKLLLWTLNCDLTTAWK